jgi:hypothetical protein
MKKILKYIFQIEIIPTNKECFLVAIQVKLFGKITLYTESFNPSVGKFIN